MVLKPNKRVLENGKVHQPAKYQKPLEYDLDQRVGLEFVPCKFSSKTCLQERVQPDNLQKLCADESLSSSGVTSLANSNSCNDDTSLEKDELEEKLVEVVKTENNVSALGTCLQSITTHKETFNSFSKRLEHAITREAELKDSQISVCSLKHEKCREYRFDMPTEEVAEAVLPNGAIGGSIMCEYGIQMHEEKVSIGHQAKDMETCKSASNVGNSRCRVPEDLDFDPVSVSPSFKNNMADCETMDQACKGYVNLEKYLSSPSVAECGGLCSRTYADSECSEGEGEGEGEHYVHYESSAGLGCFSLEHVSRKKVPIGPEFQADLPVCRPQARVFLSDAYDRMSSQPCQENSNDDDKYSQGLIGSRVWPLVGSNGIITKDAVGQGRPTYCNCPDSNSIRCVKEHIEAEREMLKLKLGEAFYSWGFHDMGESVSEKWTKEEEQTFQDLVNMNPISSNKNFWNYLSVAFPSRSKKELVSYYFNVFVLRRRAFQNRLDPDNIDSDDDEADCTNSENGMSERFLMTEEDDDSVDESDASEGDELVAGSDDETTETTEEDDEMAISSMLEGQTTYRSNHNIDFGDQEKKFVESHDEDTDAVTWEYVDHNNINGDLHLIEGQYLQDDSCMSYEWNHEKKSSGPFWIRNAGFPVVEDEKVKPGCKGQQMDINNVNDMCEDIKQKGFLSRKEELVIDGHCSLLDPSDSKLWDIALVTSLKADTDRLVSTCSMIKELFGDEARDTEKCRNRTI